MEYQNVFKRYELKYLLTKEQKERLLRAAMPYLTPDSYGRSTVRSIYFDTDNYRLIRRSAEKPAYKEKLRIRSYSQARPDSTVFAELKKKYRSVVYKRRISLSEREAMSWLTGQSPCPIETQISREIDYFLGFYGELRPTVFLSCEREAYYSAQSPDFRVTFDSSVLCRQEALSLTCGVYGQSVLDENMTLMEIKCRGAIPLWMTRILSGEHIYCTPFSKYGTAYKNIILPRQGGAQHLPKEDARYA